MKTKIFALLAAMMLLVGTTAIAQSDDTKNTSTTETSLKGDVNNDGVVDVADIAAVIAVMQEQSADGPEYYWYIGQENPAEMTSINDANIVTDKSSPGWRLIGKIIPSYSATNMLWNGDTNSITFGSRVISYIAIPYKPLQMWDISGGDGLFYTIQNNGNPTNINGVDYYIYMSDYKTGGFEMNIYNK